MISVYPRRLPKLPKPYTEYTYQELLRHSTRIQPDKHAWGMCLTHSFEAMHQLKGYNEEFVGWGFEDTDYVNRAGRAGFTTGMEDFGPLVLHQWHPTPSRSQYHRNLQISKVGKSNEGEWGAL
jgi:hypothetical protein